MRWILLTALTLALAAAVACKGGGGSDGGDGGGGGGEGQTPDGRTVLSFRKRVIETGQGEFVFTLTLANEGKSAALNVVASDVWQEGLEVTDLGVVADLTLERIGENGVEFILEELAPGETVTTGYSARCLESGKWLNTAVASASNAEGSEASVEVDCP
jgi:uncharacterized repeat protein (TIGR01451 family)